MFNFRIGETNYEVTPSVDLKQGRGELRVNNFVYPLRFHKVDSSTYVIRTDKGTFKVFVERGRDEINVIVNGYPYQVKRQGHRLREAVLPLQHGALEQISPLTPSVVVKVLVEVGDVVLKGQPLVVVSAMKMETTLKAPYKGRVKKVNIEAGAKVNPGDVLVDIEPLEESL